MDKFYILFLCNNVMYGTLWGEIYVGEIIEQEPYSQDTLKMDIGVYSYYKPLVLDSRNI
jgi:hypothetical protein